MALTSLPQNLVLRSLTIPLRVQPSQAPRSKRMIAAPSVKDTISFTFDGIVYAEDCDVETFREVRTLLWDFIHAEGGFYVSVWPGRKIKVRVPANEDIPEWPAISDLAGRITFTCVAYDPCFESDDPAIVTRYETP